MKKIITLFVAILSASVLLSCTDNPENAVTEEFPQDQVPENEDPKDEDSESDVPDEENSEEKNPEEESPEDEKHEQELVYEQDENGNEYWYDSDGNLIHCIFTEYGFLHTNWYEYDEDGRLIRHLYTNNSSDDEYWYEYDSDGNEYYYHKNSNGVIVSEEWKDSDYKLLARREYDSDGTLYLELRYDSDRNLIYKYRGAKKVSCSPTESFLNPACLNGFGFQLWSWDAVINFESGEFTAGNDGYISGAIGGFYEMGAQIEYSFGMKHVVAMEMTVSGPDGKELEIYPESKSESLDKVTIPLSTTSATVTIPHQFSQDDETGIIFSFAISNTKPGDIVKIQDIRFLRADGNYTYVDENY